jgi:hypothetical protein
MKPVDKTSEDLFQKLRSRYSPVSMGDENADETADPSEARIFNFMYKENGEEAGYVSISIIDNRNFKVYYGTDLVDRIKNKTDWYNLLKELRMFAKRNLMSFDARDLAKNQLEPRDFKFISSQDKTYKEHEVTVSESVMFGSRRKSYQTMENVKMIVNHRKSIDETIPGARSRYIESIYLERADGERYKFPYNYLTGARAMARHVNEGGNPYDDMGKHIVGMIKEMRDLSKFARRTKKHAMEDENAGGIRNSVVERFHSMKKQLGAMSVKEGYARFVENFSAEEALVEDDAINQIKERFTQQVFDTQLEDTLPAVMKAIKEAQMKQVAEANTTIPSLIKSSSLVLRKDDAADNMFRTTKFTDGAGLLGFILSDIASRAIGDNADEIANFASDAAERVQDKDYDQSDKQTAMMLAKKYMDDVKKMTSDTSYKDEIRMDPKNIYGKMKKREGGFHEAEQYEAWANELVPENNVAVEAKNPELKQLIQNYASDKDYADEYSFYGDDTMSDDYQEKADQTLALIRSKFGDKAAEHAIRAANPNYSDFNKGDSLKGGLGKWLDKTPTKSGKLNKNTQKAMRNPNNNYQRKVGGPKGTLPENSVKKKFEATTQGTVGTQGTQAPANVGQALRDPNLQRAAKNVSRVAQAADIKAPPNQIAQGMAAQATGKAPPRQTMQTIGGLGNTIMQAAASDPRKAAQLTAMMKKMVTQGKFDEDAVRKVLEAPASTVINDPKTRTSTVFKAPGTTPAQPKGMQQWLYGTGQNQNPTGSSTVKPVTPTQQFDKTQSAMPDMDAMVGQEKAKVTPTAPLVGKDPAVANALGKAGFNAAGQRVTNIPSQTGAARANIPTGSMPAAKMPSIPAGTGAAKANIPVGSMPASTGYTVKAGDNLSKILTGKGMAATPANIAKIAKLSGIKDPNMIKPGQTIKFN